MNEMEHVVQCNVRRIYQNNNLKEHLIAFSFTLRRFTNFVFVPWTYDSWLLEFEDCSVLDNNYNKTSIGRTRTNLTGIFDTLWITSTNHLWSDGIIVPISLVAFSPWNHWHLDLL